MVIYIYIFFLVTQSNVNPLSSIWVSFFNNLFLNNLVYWLGFLMKFNSFTLIYWNPWLFFNVILFNPLDEFIPFTNTLFTIHPPLLIVSVNTIFVGVFLTKQLPHLSATLCLIISVMVLGGAWAFQELSWGGWWNWDLIELGLAALMVSVILLMHIFNKFNKETEMLVNFFIFIFWLFKYINITNLTISIHNFIKNNFHYFFYWYVFIAVTTFTFWRGVTYICVITSVLFLATSLVDVIVFKKIILIGLFFFKKVNFINNCKNTIHRFFFLILICITIFNYNNVGNFNNYSPLTQSLYFFYKNECFGFSRDGVKVIFTRIMFSKINFFKNFNTFFGDMGYLANLIFLK